MAGWRPSCSSSSAWWWAAPAAAGAGAAGYRAVTTNRRRARRLELDAARHEERPRLPHASSRLEARVARRQGRRARREGSRVTRPPRRSPKRGGARLRAKDRSGPRRLNLRASRSRHQGGAGAVPLRAAGCPAPDRGARRPPRRRDRTMARLRDRPDEGPVVSRRCSTRSIRRTLAFLRAQRDAQELRAAATERPGHADDVPRLSRCRAEPPKPPSRRRSATRWAIARDSASDLSGAR